MMNVYQNNAAGDYQKMDHIAPNSWVQLLAPSAQELSSVAATLNLPLDFLKAAQNHDERPRMETRGEHTLLVVHVPLNDPAVAHSFDDVKYRTMPLGIIFGQDHIVTVCQEENLFNRGFLMQHRLSVSGQNLTHNALTILNQTAQAFIDFMKVVETATHQAERELANSYRNQELYTLLYLNESLLYMATSLKQLRHLMQQLAADDGLSMNPTERALFADTVVELQQVSAITEINQLNLNNVMDAYGNIIQNNVSHIVKLLTAITIVLSIPTLIASIYGMNVPLPYQDEPYAFHVVIISMVVLSAFVAFVFHKKRYF
ncbi:MAG: magnesium transporter CorA family protein [Neisseriaceae bacterium]|nr:magnesium transporter CorA family protein [Neisseriaceae bacterium]MBP6863417.1 magnesium transporter CorA family protein [Neisseriaceae bacterium]